MPREGSSRNASDWRDHCESVVMAAAAMTAVSEHARHEVPKIRSSPEFIRPLVATVQDGLANYSRRGLAVAARDRAAERLAELECVALERLAALGGYLTHTDYRAGNVFLRVGEKPVIFDWDSASLGPPGATLRFMARLPASEQERVVDLYCAHLEAKGFRFHPADVMFAMRSAAVFHALAHAARFSAASDPVAERIFGWGLGNIEYLAT
ncbi:MAG: aminoglycoside phosphotransferase family protein [Pseudomonadota bacterium]|nr:aminoglycoside phosphotransferase family protein [Pseudomonadota bacterium]